MKKNKTISFRLASYTDAAGKYSPDAVRGGNEDNFYVDDDLTDGTTNKAAQDEIMQLGAHGMLMVVADGMGGMNAGEVASQIAVDTVKQSFKASDITDDIAGSAASRQKYMEQVIRKADKNIKSEARKDRSREGMGSTIIMAWLYGNELTVSWCGDSRAYIFNDKSGIRLISQDHSYVQELVNKGCLTYDQTFDHPQNNIITRSLGDPTKEAKGESKTIEVGKSDIILICSDGLSGVLRDRKTYDSNGKPFPEDNLEDIIRAHSASMKECREALWAAAEQGGWYDNVTAILCQITDGPESKWGQIPFSKISTAETGKKFSGKRNIFFILLALLVIAAIAGAFFIGRSISVDSKGEEADVVSDIVPNNADSVIMEQTEADDALKEEVGQDIIERGEIAKEIKEENKGEAVKKVTNDSANSKSELTPIQAKESSELTLKSKKDKFNMEDKTNDPSSRNSIRNNPSKENPKK